MSLLKLAEKFERKLLKYAEEVDSTILTLSIRPKIDQLLESYKPRFLAAVAAIAKATKPDADGNFPPSDLSVGGHFFTTASKVGGKWAVSKAQVQTTGNLATNPKIVQLIDAFNKAAAPLIQFELNRMAANLEGDTITNHDATVNTVSTGF